MYVYLYKHGDRPLDGYTIQRAAGRGGFGEVYYAVSDSGREIALKAVQGYEQIELRGITQCMNLKSPHLVSIFDVKYNDSGRPFVLMEFVAGPTLRQLIDESPAGLGVQKSAFFLREMGKGLTYLHDCGIVHRDLKPGNVFFENGYVKIGDYGLSKAMSVSQHSGQTVTVGTVHYMAPEIGVGRYDKSIDIYALGAVLFEMLTGTVPFLGSSPSEVLMKHLAAEPDVTGIEEPFATVIKKAMAKSAADRYQSVQEMVEAVFGTEHVRMSMTHFSPGDLSMVAGRVAQRVGGGSTAAGGSGPFIPEPPRSDRPSSVTRPSPVTRPTPQPDPVDRLAGRLSVSDTGNPALTSPSAPTTILPPLPRIPPSKDPLPLLYRVGLAGIASVITVGIATLFSKGRAGDSVFVFFATLGAGWGAALGLLFAHRKLLSAMQQESAGLQRLVAICLAAAGMILLSFPFWLDEDTLKQSLISLALATIGAMLVVDSAEWISRSRPERVQFGKIIAVGVITWVGCLIFGAHSAIWLGVGVTSSAAVIAQLLASWKPGVDTEDVESRDLGTRLEAQLGFDIDSSQAPVPSVEASGFRRGVWLALTIVAASMAVSGFIFAGSGPSSAHQIVGGSLGTSGLLLTFLGAIRALSRRYRGLWRDVVRPIAIWVSGSVAITGMFIAGNARDISAGQSALVGGMIVCGSLSSVIMLMLPRRAKREEPVPAAPTTPIPPGSPTPLMPLADHMGAPVRPAAPTIIDWADRARRNAVKVVETAKEFKAKTDRRADRVRRAERGPIAMLLGLVGFLLLTASFAVGVVLAIDVPSMIEAGFPDPKIRAEIRRSVTDANAARAAKAAAAPTQSGKVAAASVPANNTALNQKSVQDQFSRSVQALEMRSVETMLAIQTLKALSNAGRNQSANSEIPVEPNASATSNRINELNDAMAKLRGQMEQVLGDLKANSAATPTGLMPSDEALWPTVARGTLMLTWAVLTMLGLTCLLFARRVLGPGHMIRAVVGVGLLMMSLLPLHEATAGVSLWSRLEGQPDQVVAREVVNAFTSRLSVAAAVVFLTSVVVLAWPGKRPQERLTAEVAT